MIDLHTHTILSDGVLLPSELARRAMVNGYKAIGITDHVDYSNVDTVISGIVKVAVELNKYWDVIVIPGVELTHIPIEAFKEFVEYCREKGAKIIIAHGESPVEPVCPGTNRVAILAGVDILAHPGYITEEDAVLAAEKGVHLELTTRRGHSTGNKHVLGMAIKAGAKLVLNTDSHGPEDLLTVKKRDIFLASLTDDVDIVSQIIKNSQDIVDRIMNSR